MGKERWSEISPVLLRRHLRPTKPANQSCIPKRSEFLTAVHTVLSAATRAPSQAPLSTLLHRVQGLVKHWTSQQAKPHSQRGFKTDDKELQLYFTVAIRYGCTAHPSATGGHPPIGHTLTDLCCRPCLQPDHPYSVFRMHSYDSEGMSAVREAPTAAPGLRKEVSDLCQRCKDSQFGSPAPAASLVTSQWCCRWTCVSRAVL